MRSMFVGGKAQVSPPGEEEYPRRIMDVGQNHGFCKTTLLGVGGSVTLQKWKTKKSLEGMESWEKERRVSEMMGSHGAHISADSHPNH